LGLYIELYVDVSEKKGLVRGTQCDPIASDHMVNEKM
jgi:hypothetical protein